MHSMMKKALIFCVVLGITIFLVSNAFGWIYFNDLRDQVKMTLAEESPRFPDAIINDFLFLAIQNVAGHGLACQFYTTQNCSSLITDYMFTDALNSAGYARQALFIQAMNIEYGWPSHRAIWEILPKDLAKKQLINPPTYQYYYIWHTPDTSFFHFFADPSYTRVVFFVFYHVPLSFAGSSGGIVLISGYYEEIIIEYTLYLCYTRIKAWDLRSEAYNNYAKNISVIREIHINRPPDITFGPKEIQ